ncbi:MAG: hypothetical protein JST91_22655 [Actinobacteria bacterium]|nr:hypothetical protein [Actinomycetota bacterium]
MRVRRLIGIGAFAVAAVAAPFAASALTASAGQETVAGPACLAWFGNKEDGRCLSYSNGSPVVGGMPPVAWGSPGSGNPGVTTGPILPGTTISQGIG